MDEITENLLEPKKNNKKVIIIVIIICTVLLIALLSFLFLRHRYLRDLEFGQDYLNIGNYEQSYDYFKEATTLNPNSQIAYEGLAEAALRTGNNNEAKNCYENLFNITGNELYKTLAYYSDYGNIGGNLTNGGNICLQGNLTFIADNSTKNAKIWKLTDTNTILLATFPIQNYQPITQLNAWGNSLYFLVGETLYTINISTGESKSLNKNNITRLTIFKNILYYLTDEGKLYSCELDGSGETLVYQPTPKRGWNFVITNDYIYLVSTDTHGTFSSVEKISILNNMDVTEILFVTNKLITTMAFANNAIYFQYLNTSADLNELLPYADGIYVLDLSNDKSALLMNPLQVSSVNTDGLHLYYITEGVFYRCNMDTGGIKKIGTGSKPSSPTDYISRIGYSIGLTPFKVYLTTSTLNGMEPIGINNTIMSTLTTGDDPALNYNLVNLSSNDNKGYSTTQNNTTTNLNSGTHRYELVSGNVSWEEASEEARKRGGYLAHIDSESEFNTIVNLLNQKRSSGSSVKEYYIGGRRNYVDQTYRWVDEYGDMYGDSVQNTLGNWFWYEGEPSYVDPNNPTYEEPFLSIMYVDRIGRWVGNDTVLDITSSFPEYTNKVGYIIEYEN